MKILREHQKRSIDLVRGSLKAGHRHPILALPTGGGKTLIAANIVKSARAKNNRVIFVVPALSLIDQTVESFLAEGITGIGVIQADHALTNYSMPVQVASIQTLTRRETARLPHTDLVIVDEAHVMYKKLFRLMDEWDAVRFVGLSATPWTKGLGRYYDDLIIGATTQELIDKGYLSKFRVFAPTTPDLSKVRIVAGDFHEGDLSEVMDKGTVTGDVVSNWLKRGENRPTLCFGVNRAHAKSLADEFEANGVPTAYIDAYTEMDERARISKAFTAGDIKIICNVGTMTTGVDLDVRCLILARPTKSKSLFVQIIGRALRIAPGKDHALIFDHTGTHSRLGFVTDIHSENLCDGKPKEKSTKEKEEPLPKECTKCKFMKPAKVHECPACGFKPERQSDVEHQKGELVELKAKKKLNKEMTPEEKKKFYGELIWYAKHKGYKEGWSSNKYKEKTGVFPNHYKGAPMVEPSAETYRWIQHTQIKWAKQGAAKCQNA